jgi:Heavy metal associated domain 2
MTTPTETPGLEESARSASAPAAAKQAPKRAPQRAKQKAQPAGMKVEHSAHGRTRARLSKEHRTPEKMAAIQEELEKHPDVQNVEIDQRTGSVVITHDKDRQGHQVMKEALQDVEMLAGLLFEVPIGEDEDEAGGDETERLDRKIADLLSRADEWQAQRTGIHGRGVILSGAVAALGVAQIAIYGISLEMLPGPMLLYIAYDIHRKVREDEMEMEGRGKKAGKQTAGSSEPAAKGLQPTAA